MSPSDAWSIGAAAIAGAVLGALIGSGLLAVLVRHLRWRRRNVAALLAHSQHEQGIVTFPTRGRASVHYDAARDRWIASEAGKTWERPGDFSGTWELQP